jgi:transmembrane sensor
MKGPPEPLGSLLQQDASEEELQRIWRAVQRQRTRKSAPGAPLLLVVAVLSSLALAAFGWWWPPTKAGGPLRDEGGRALLLIEGSSRRSTALSDGSRIQLWVHSALEVLENDGDTFVCALRRGQARFDVVPGGPRRWRVEVGAVAIEVVGTRFRVDRRDDRVIVEVEQGTVLVRGENVRDGVQKLQSRARLEVPLTRPPNVEAQRAAIPAGRTNSATSAAKESDTAKESDAARLGDASAPAPGIDLLTLADRQRRDGDLKGAIQTLKLAVERAPDNTRAATAAFILGKLLLDGTGQPVEAQAAFRACLNRSPPSAIAEDAMARLVEAQSRSGARDAALATAREYQMRYPNGRRLSDVRRWTSTR